MTKKVKGLISLYVLQRNVEVCMGTPLIILAMFREFFDFEKVAKINLEMRAICSRRSAGFALV